MSPKRPTLSPLLREPARTATPTGLSVLRRDREEAPALDRVADVHLDAVRFEHQPRELIPPTALDDLLARDEATPAGLLATLRTLAEHDAAAAGILEDLRALATSIVAQGVLTPVHVIERAGRLVVRDGHRRCVASLLAGRERVPCLLAPSGSAVEAAAAAFVVNVQRSDLTAIEKGLALRNLAILTARELALAEPGRAEAAELFIAALERGEEGEDGEAGAGRPGGADGPVREVALAVRERLCSLAGMSTSRYYQFLALARLTPLARQLGRGLTELQLRPFASVPPEYQAELVRFAATHGLSGSSSQQLARVARQADWDAVREIMARLSDRRGPARAAVSWEGLLTAYPEDVSRRLDALDTELAALAPAARARRLAAIRAQLERIAFVEASFRALLEKHGPSG